MNSETNIKTGFADEEFENRTLRAQEIMHKYDLDGILSVSYTHLTLPTKA